MCYSCCVMVYGRCFSTSLYYIVTCVSRELDDGLTGLLQVKYPQDLVIGAGGQGSRVRAEVDALDNVLVLQRQLLLSRQGIPDLKIM